MDQKYILIGISIIIIGLIYFYWKGYWIEEFESIYPESDIITKPIDAISVIPEPLVNPNKVVVVITKGEYVWKYDIISKRFSEMDTVEKRMAGLKPIDGYPKLIRHEWTFLGEYFHEDLTGIATMVYNRNTPMPEIQFYKNRFKYVLNTSSQWKGIKMAGAVPILPSDKTPLDINQGFDSITSYPDYTLPAGSNDEVNAYVNTVFPETVSSGGVATYSPKYKIVHQIHKGPQAYIVEVQNASGTKIFDWNINHLKLKTFNDYFSTTTKNPLDGKTLPLHLHNYQAYHHPKMGNALHSQVYTNDLFNCMMLVNDNVHGVENCNLWHQIKRKPRCAFTYPLQHTRQNPSYVYVFDDKRVYKYRAIDEHEDINTILSLVSGYPKMIGEEYPNLHVNFTDNLDGVWYHNEHLYFVKGNMGTKYNLRNKAARGIFNIKSLFRDIDDKYIEAFVQTKEDDNVFITLYSDNQFIKYQAGAHVFTKVADWQAVPTDENRNNDPVLCGWYHPKLNKKVITYKQETLCNGNTYQNADLYHAYSKTIILSDKLSDAHLLIQQPLVGDNRVMGFTIDSGRVTKIENDNLPGGWRQIISKNIPEMGGAIYVESMNQMKYIFANDKHYRFVASGQYHGFNYNTNIWSNPNNSNTQEFPNNFDQEKPISPSNIDFCFYDNNQLVWFFKNGNCWKYNIESNKFTEYNRWTHFFPDLDLATQSVAYDWNANKVYFIKGNTYTIYNYNATKSTKVQSDVSMYDLMETEVARETSMSIKAFSPTNAKISDAYDIQDVTLNINSLHNFIQNGDFIDTMNAENLGEITATRQIISSNTVVGDLPFNGNALRYSMDGGDIVNLTLPELYVSDIVFSFYIKKDPSTPNFNVVATTESATTNQITVQVTNDWQRVELYQWHNFENQFGIKVSIPAGGNKTFYATGFQLENNLHALPFFSGRVFHTWDETNPPEIAYVYNVNHLSTIPPQQNEIDITTLMGYNTLRQERNDDGIGFEKEQAVHFDGKKVFMTIPTTKLKPTRLSEFAVSMWVRFREFSSPPGYQAVWGTQSEDGQKYIYLDEIGGKLRVKIRNGRTLTHVFETIHLNSYKWYFIGLTIHEGKLRLYAYHYYEDVDIRSVLLQTKIDDKIMVGVPPNYSDMIYKNHMLFADVGSISIWRRKLKPDDIKILSRTFKDVKLALPEITKHQLVGKGLAIEPLVINVSHITGLGLCTYNAHIKWVAPQLPLDYKKLGYNIIKYESKVEYYVGGNLVPKEKLEPHILAERIIKEVKDIKFRVPQIQCKDCEMVVINIPYEYNYRLYVRYVLSNAEMSSWAEMDLRFRDDLVPRFNITSGTTCKYKVYQIDPKDKIKAQQTQNKFLEYSRKKLSELRLK